MFVRFLVLLFGFFLSLPAFVLADGSVSRRTSTRSTTHYSQGHVIKTTLYTTVTTHTTLLPKQGKKKLRIVTVVRRVIKHTYPNGRISRKVSTRTTTRTRLVNTHIVARPPTKTTNLWGAGVVKKPRWGTPTHKALPGHSRGRTLPGRPRILRVQPKPQWKRPIPVLRPRQGRWSQADYQRFNFRGFWRLREAQRPLNPKRLDLGLLRAAVFYETNRQRAKHRLPALRHSNLLQQAAQEHSDDMVRYRFFSHNSPLKGKQTPANRVHRIRFVQWGVGENIATSFALRYPSGSRAMVRNGRLLNPKTNQPFPFHTYLSAARAVVNQWMTSRGHRENILSKRYKTLGLGVAYYKKGMFPSFKWTQVFAHPL